MDGPQILTLASTSECILCHHEIQESHQYLITSSRLLKSFSSDAIGSPKVFHLLYITVCISSVEFEVTLRCHYTWKFCDHMYWRATGVLSILYNSLEPAFYIPCIPYSSLSPWSMKVSILYIICKSDMWAFQWYIYNLLSLVCSETSAMALQGWALKKPLAARILTMKRISAKMKWMATSWQSWRECCFLWWDAVQSARNICGSYCVKDGFFST